MSILIAVFFLAFILFVLRFVYDTLKMALMFYSFSVSLNLSSSILNRIYKNFLIHSILYLRFFTRKSYLS